MSSVVNDGVRVRYDVTGSGRPLFLLHGATLDGSVWSRAGYVGALAGDHRLFIVDLRGHGKSDKPHDPEALRSSAMAKDILAIADAEVLARFAIWGWSLGTAVAWATALSAPDRVVAIIGTGDSDPRPWTEEEWASFDQALLEPLRRGGMAAFVEQVQRSEQDKLEAADLMLRADPDVVLALFSKELITTDGLRSVEDFLVPALLIAGEFEDGDGDAERIAASVRHGEFLVLPGLGHPGAFFRSDLVLPTARAFLDRWFRR